MSILSEKYKVPEPVIKSMIQDGVISCKWMGWEEVVKLHKEGKSVDDIAAHCNVTPRQVYLVLRKVK